MERLGWAWLAAATVLGTVVTSLACSSDDSGTTTASSGSGAASASSGPAGSGGSFMCNDAGVDANDTPPTVEIIQPTEGATFMAGAIIPLKGSAVDAVDGPITSPQQLFWFKDIVDPTGEGTEDSVDPAEDGALPPGMHPITFKATNSRCLEAEKTVNIVVQ